MKVAIVNSSVANLASVKSALDRMEIDATITDDPEILRAASHVILPGVGAAPAAMKQLDAKNLRAIIRSLTQPVLGICLGMQILFDSSEEGGEGECLGLIPGKVKKLPPAAGCPIPHMGWNEISIRAPEHPLFRKIPNNSFVYFVHSFAAPIGPSTLASCAYSEPFAAVVGHHNFFGCQFHPERSGAVGQRLLKNFLDM